MPRDPSLCYLLRPELVRGYSLPISSQRETPERVEMEGRSASEASMYLDEDVIPSTCAHLEAMRAPMISSLPVNLKLMGVNMRYGFVHSDDRHRASLFVND